MLLEISTSYCLYHGLREVLLLDLNGSHIMKGAPEPSVGRPGLYLFTFEVVAVEEEDSKHTKLCMNYDVICSAFSSLLGSTSKFVFNGFSSGGPHQHPPKGNLRMLPILHHSQITARATRNRNPNNLQFTLFDVRCSGDTKPRPLSRM